MNFKGCFLKFSPLNVSQNSYFLLVLELTLYGPNSFCHRFSGHNLRKALFVYRLIGATLIGNFFDDPFLK